MQGVGSRLRAANAENAIRLIFTVGDEVEISTGVHGCPRWDAAAEAACPVATS